MKTLIASLALAGSLALPLAANGATSSWDIDPAHTTAGFSVTHMMFTTVRGDFSKVSGTLVLDDEDVSKSSVNVSIDTNSIDTHVADRDKHLKSADFFDAEKNPTITFKSTKVEKNGDGKLKVTGDLTMHGVTKPVVLDVNGPSNPIKSPWGTEVRSASATATINRKDWGLGWNKALESGGVVVSDEVKLEINAEFGPHKADVAKEAKAETKTKATPKK
jgi:polyisoprenoid-binding protein YceI